jgi:hypothetical protein
MALVLLVLAGRRRGERGAGCAQRPDHRQVPAEIRVARPDGSNRAWAASFVARYLPMALVGAVPFVGGMVSLVDSLLIFRDDRRCLHDQIADTIVVRA